MENVQLYADFGNGWKELDIDHNIRLDNLFTFNLTYENTDSPTTITNTRSNDISLPATQNNNALFEHIGLFDQIINNFNPLNRTPYLLTLSNTIIESGYFELLGVIQKKFQPYQYKVRLYGSLGDFFYTLSEKDVSDLNVGSIFEHKIGRDSVKATWDYDNQYYKYALTYSGGYDNFSQDTVIRQPAVVSSGFRRVIFAGGKYYATTDASFGFIYSSSDGESFDVVPGTQGTFDVAYYSGLFISANGSNLKRSTDGENYYTAVQGSINHKGIKYILDRWISFGNRTDSPPYANYFHSTNGNAGAGNWTSVSITQTISSILDADGLFLGSTRYYVFVTGNGVFYTTNFSSHTALSGTGTGQLPALNLNSIAASGTYLVIVGSGGRNYYSTNVNSWTAGSGIPSTVTLNKVRFLDAFYAVGDNGAIYRSSTGSSWTDYSQTFDFNINFSDIAQNSNGEFIAVGDTGYATSSGGISGTWTPHRGEEQSTESGEEEDEHQRNDFRSYYQRPAIRLKYLIEQIIADVAADGFTVNLDPTFFNEDNPYWWDTWVLLDRLKFDYSNDQEIGQAELDEQVRSGDQINFKTMMRSGVTQLEFLLGYTKIFGMKYRIDKTGKEITIVTRNTFFQDYKLEDWTRKIDYSKTTEINPYIFNSRYYLLGWENSGSHYEVRYEGKYNNEFARQKIDTGYSFNTKEVDFISDPLFINLVCSREYDLRFTRGINYRDDKVLPALFTKSNNVRQYMEASMALVFYGGMKDVAEPFYITDDSSEAALLGVYSWQETEPGLECTQYPYFTRLLPDKRVSLDIAKPNEYYYEVTDEEYQESYTIYSRFWERYINDRYNVNSRKLTANALIGVTDFQNLEFGNFVNIGDTIWHPNKVNGYNLLSDGSTKTELVRVESLQNYVSGQIIPGSDIERINVTFNVTPTNGTILVNGVSYTGTATISVIAGTEIGWIASAPGYTSQSGSRIFNSDEVVNIILVVAPQRVKLTFVVTPSFGSISAGGIVTVGTVTYEGFPGNTINWTAYAEGYISQSGTETYDVDRTVQITLVPISNIQVTARFAVEPPTGSIFYYGKTIAANDGNVNVGGGTPTVGFSLPVSSYPIGSTLYWIYKQSGSTSTLSGSITLQANNIIDVDNTNID